MTKFDIFDLQHRLPAFILKLPYEIMNRLNRNKLQSFVDHLVASITHDDYVVSDEADTSLDLLAVLTR